MSPEESYFYSLLSGLDANVSYHIDKHREPVSGLGLGAGGTEMYLTNVYAFEELSVK